MRGWTVAGVLLLAAAVAVIVVVGFADRDGARVGVEEWWPRIDQRDEDCWATETFVHCED